MNKCLTCDISFGGRKKRKYCSTQCYWEALKGKSFSIKTQFKNGERASLSTEFKKGEHLGVEFKKGNIPWNKLSYEQLCYRNRHKWIERNYGKPTQCEHCGDTSEQRRINWANKNHTYKRKRSDWMQLCCSCHKLYDLHGVSTKI